LTGNLPAPIDVYEDALDIKLLHESDGNPVQFREPL